MVSAMLRDEVPSPTYEVTAINRVEETPSLTRPAQNGRIAVAPIPTVVPNWTAAGP